MEASELIIPILAIVVTNFTVVFVIYYGLKTENTRKLALIEKGMDPSLAERKPPKDINTTLKNGIFIIGIAIGIVFGYILTLLLPIQLYVSYPSMILLFGGLALIIYYGIENRKRHRSTSS